MEAIAWKYYIVWCVWLIVQIGIVYFFFPETYGLGLEEIAQIFGDDISHIKKAGDRAIVDDDVSLKKTNSIGKGQTTHVEQVV